jgi:hypothetical protein
MVALGADSGALVDRLATYEILGELGARTHAVKVVRHRPPDGKASLAVLERFDTVMRGDADAGAAFLRRARRIATLAHPNLTAVRELIVNADDLLVAGPFLDGEKLSELWQVDREAMPLAVGLRVLVGVIAGLGALHRLSDGNQQPMRLAHGEIAPTTILFGIDGVARVLHAIARQAPGAEAEPASRDYVAPEAAAGEPFDERADVFGLGVLLWEMLSRRRLCVEDRRSSVPLASTPDDAPWARGLADVAAKALEPAPENRWPTAAAMAVQIHEVAGPRVASLSTAAGWINATAGERVRARRARLESAGAPDSSHSVVLPRSSPRVAGANPVGRARVRAATLPLMQLAEAARILEEARTGTSAHFANPSESKVQVRQHAAPSVASPALAAQHGLAEWEHPGSEPDIDPIPESVSRTPGDLSTDREGGTGTAASRSGVPHAIEPSSEPVLSLEGEAVDETPFDWSVAASAPVQIGVDSTPSRTDRPEERAPGLATKRRIRVVIAVASAAAAIAGALGIWAARAHGRVHMAFTRQATAAVEIAPVAPSGEPRLDEILFETAHLNARALPEARGGTPKGTPSKRSPGRPTRAGASQRTTR